MLFVRVIFVSGISNFVVTSCKVSISNIYCHEVTARDAIFGLRNGNKYLIKNFFFHSRHKFRIPDIYIINTYALILKKDFQICKSITEKVC